LPTASLTVPFACLSDPLTRSLSMCGAFQNGVKPSNRTESMGKALSNIERSAASHSITSSARMSARGPEVGQRRRVGKGSCVSARPAASRF
jgi:hypothetical protein